MQTNPIEFKPSRAADFIGSARDMALILDRMAARSTAAGQPVKLLLQGDPGIGKSALLDYFVPQLGADKWTITKLNGTQLNVERVEDWASRLCYRELTGGYKVLRIEEIDKASVAAQVRLLTVLDDLPSHTAIVATSNKQINEIDARFQTRFQGFTLKPPTGDEIVDLLSRWPLREADARRIAAFACGNVRVALLDAQSSLDEQGALAEGRLI